MAVVMEVAMAEATVGVGTAAEVKGAAMVEAMAAAPVVVRAAARAAAAKAAARAGAVMVEGSVAAATVAVARAVGKRAAAKAERKSVVHSQCNPCPIHKERHTSRMHLRPRQQSLHGYLAPSTGHRRLH